MVLLQKQTFSPPNFLTGQPAAPKGGSKMWLQCTVQLEHGVRGAYLTV